MGKDPVNIRRLVAQNDQFARAEAYSRQIGRGSQVAEWHEHTLHRSGAPTKPPTGQKSINRGTTSAGAVEMMDELTAMKSTVLKERQARLKELMDSERLMFEQELNAMGLAISKYAY